MGELDRFSVITDEQEIIKNSLHEVRQAWLEMNEALKRIEHVQLNHQQVLDLITMQYMETHIPKVKVKTSKI